MFVLIFHGENRNFLPKPPFPQKMLILQKIPDQLYFFVHWLFQKCQDIVLKKKKLNDTATVSRHDISVGQYPIRQDRNFTVPFYKGTSCLSLIQLFCLIGKLIQKLQYIRQTFGLPAARTVGGKYFCNLGLPISGTNSQCTKIVQMPALLEWCHICLQYYKNLNSDGYLNDILY